MSEIPLEVQMHAERLYDEGGYEAVPTIIAKAIIAEREQCASAQEELNLLRSGVKRLSDEEELCAETTGDDPFSMVYLAAKLNDVEKQLEALARRHEKALIYASMMRGALQTISSPTQTENLLWWQIEAREALSWEPSP